MAVYLRIFVRNQNQNINALNPTTYQTKVNKETLMLRNVSLNIGP